MISTDFAPNESWDDAWTSFKLIFQPWQWENGKEIELVKQNLISKLFPRYHIATDRSIMVHLFLSGRSALYFLLKSFNLSPGSEVIIQAFTCEAVVLPILANNLKPIYMGIESETYSMDFNSLTRKLVNRKTNSTKVLILQHTFGLTPKFRNEILKLAHEHKLIVIEDLAHGFSQQLTISNQQTYFLLSFGRSKAISSVFGGAVVSFSNGTMEQWNNLSYPSYFFIFRCLLYKPLAMLIKSTYDFYVGKVLHKILNEFGLLIPEITVKEKSGGYDKLFNKAYPNGLSVLLLHQLKKLDRVKEQRAKICEIYSRVILNPSMSLRVKRSNLRVNSAKDLVPPLAGRNLRFARFLASLRMTDRALIRYPLLVNNRAEILAKARKHNIFLGVWYDQVVAPKDLDISRVGYRPGSCPKAEEICKKIINLPTNISEKEAEKIINILVLSERSELKD